LDAFLTLKKSTSEWNNDFLAAAFSIHHIVNGAAAYHIENAANLDKVPLSRAWVMIAPVKIEKGSGGPARVWVVFR
jgi:kynurenine formamidase